APAAGYEREAWPRLPLCAACVAEYGMLLNSGRPCAAAWRSRGWILCTSTPLNLAMPRGGETALHMAAVTGRTAAVRTLLAAGADPNRHTKSGVPTRLSGGCPGLVGVSSWLTVRHPESAGRRYAAPCLRKTSSTRASPVG